MGEAARFLSRRVTIEPGHELDGGCTHWRGAIVVVVRGEVEVSTLGGARGRFLRGDVLWFDGLDITRLGNPGREPAVLVAVRRSGSAGSG
jgi:hypothetical protein